MCGCNGQKTSPRAESERSLLSRLVDRHHATKGTIAGYILNSSLGQLHLHGRMDHYYGTEGVDTPVCFHVWV